MQDSKCYNVTPRGKITIPTSSNTNALNDQNVKNVKKAGHDYINNTSTSIYYKIKEKKRDNMQDKGLMEKEMELALFFVEQIRLNMPKFKEPKILHWVKQIEKIHRIDRYDYAEIRSMIVFAQNHNFWWKNILSPEKLRKQWERLEAEKIKFPPNRKKNTDTDMDIEEKESIKKQFIE